VSDVAGGEDEVLVVEQIEQHLDDSETATDDLMPRSSPDGSTDNDVDHEQHGNRLQRFIIAYRSTY